MKILLGKTQVQQLRRFKDRIQATAALGNPGMLVAQLSWDQEGRWWLTPAFLDHELAKTITQKGKDWDAPT